MAERLGASFSIDTTDLKTGLAQANRLIKESQSEFKAAAAGMDDWTKSEEGLNAKIKSLNSITAVQREKVSALKNEYQRLIDNGLDPTSKEAVSLRTKINQEEAALKSNEAELRRQKDALKNVGDESKEAGEGFSKLGEAAKTAGKVAVAALTAAAAAVGAIAKQAIESYANYEQLVGGVETLFGTGGKNLEEYAKETGRTTADAARDYQKMVDAQNAVMKNAANAYKTAGMSANDYMETVTGFSASLIQSVGGDTEKAARLADQAITDMSDNANKMGSDIASIQNAYGGFAKQNYTMLDNLKLGYGGTKEEMQRLLDDAEKLSGVKYDLSSYADIVDAIHVVQTEMGITGTTAREAASTISGSLSMMGGAWQNLLTGIADEDADVDGLINQLIEAVQTVAANLIPRIQVVLNGIVKLVAGLIPQIPPLIEGLLPEMIPAIMALVQGIVDIFPDVIQMILGILPQLLTALLGMTPSLLTACMDIITQLILAIADMLPTIVNSIMDILPQLISALVASIPQLLQAAIQLLMAIIQAIPTITTALVDNLPVIISTIISTLLANLPLLIKGAVQLFGALITAIPIIIAELANQIPQIIRGIVDGLENGIPQMLDAGKQMLAGLFDGLIDFQAIADACKKLFDNIVGGLKSLFGIHSPSRVMADVIGKNLALGIGEGFEDNIGAVNDMIADSMNINGGSFSVDGTVNGGAKGTVVVNQYNTYSQAHSRYEIYKSKQQTAAAVRLAMAGG